MSHTITDQELMEELRLRFERSRKAFADLTTDSFQSIKSTHSLTRI